MPANQADGRSADSRVSDSRAEALLDQAVREHRGRLKIFFGAAPGVGKTYEMLRDAAARRLAGADVVVGVVETHGRQETAALLDGLEVLPRRATDYKDSRLDEFDLDALLKRRPKLVLIDELAHSNAPGSRHPKRYLDVEEILASGIDVNTTLNVQHLESLNDVVAQITRVRVRETVPDRVFDQADEIEIIDLTPEELLKRLQAGKVYVPEQAQRAVANYFSPGNLTALRELALRRTAQRVDDQMVNYMQAHAIPGPWPAGDRVMVCISEDPQSAERVRYALRMADRLRARWTAVYVEGPRHHMLSEAALAAIADTQRLAMRLGGETVTLTGNTVADALLDYARDKNVTHIVIGKAERSRWFELMHGSIVHRLFRHSGQISIHVIAAASGKDASTSAPLPGTAAPPTFADPAAYLWSAGFVAVAGVLCAVLDRLVQVTNLALVLLMAVLASAVRFGRGPSIFACLLSVAVYNFFFLPPLYTFTIAEPENVVTLVFFLATALVTSNLTSLIQRHARAVADRSRTTEELYTFSRKVAGIRKLKDLVDALTGQIGTMLDVPAVVLLPRETGLEQVGTNRPDRRLDPADMAAAAWSFAQNRPAGQGSDTLPGGKVLFLPLENGRGAVGLLGIWQGEKPLRPEGQRLLTALLDQTAVAIERIRLAGDVDRVKLQAATERLRNAMLTSVSHDLRTPLASIIGSLSSLRSFDGSFDPAMRQELLATAQDEAERLNRFVGNLLDMTRLQSGGVAPKAEAIEVADVAASVMKRVAGLASRHRIVLAFAEDLPMVTGDFVLLEQVLFNLIDNAVKYAAADTEIAVTATATADTVAIDVTDEGPGIPEDALETIFAKFTRLEQGDRRRAGTGLGLAISRGFVEAMGGRITAGNRLDRSGAVFRITLPVADIRLEDMPLANVPLENVTLDDLTLEERP